MRNCRGKNSTTTPFVSNTDNEWGSYKPYECVKLALCCIFKASKTSSIQTLKPTEKGPWNKKSSTMEERYCKYATEEFRDPFLKLER